MSWQNQHQSSFPNATNTSVEGAGNSNSTNPMNNQNRQHYPPPPAMANNPPFMGVRPGVGAGEGDTQHNENHNMNPNAHELRQHHYPIPSNPSFGHVPPPPPQPGPSSSNGGTMAMSAPPPPVSAGVAMNHAGTWNSNQQQQHYGSPPPPPPHQPVATYPSAAMNQGTSVAMTGTTMGGNGTNGAHNWNTLPPPPPAPPLPPANNNLHPSAAAQMMPPPPPSSAPPAVPVSSSVGVSPSQHFSQQRAPPPPPSMTPYGHPSQVPPPPPHGQHQVSNHQFQQPQPPPPPPPPGAVPAQQMNPSYPYPPSSTAPSAYNNNYSGGNHPQAIPQQRAISEITNYLQPTDQPNIPIYHPRQSILHTTTETRPSPPPPSNSRYLVQDDGNASPRLLRATSHLFPKDSNVERKVGVGMGLLCSPLAVASDDYAFHVRANKHADEYDDNEEADNEDDNNDKEETEPEPEAIPVIYHHANAHNTVVGKGSRAVTPIRCTSCFAYINPFTEVTDNGMAAAGGGNNGNLKSMLPWPLSAEAEFKFRCNFCGAANRITAGSGWSADVQTMPLKFGTVEYEVGGAFVTRKPTGTEDGTNDTTDVVVPPPVHLYALDGQDGKKLRAYLNAVGYVARGLGKSWHRQKRFRKKMATSKAGNTGAGVATFDGDGSIVPPRIGILVYAQDHVIVPHWSAKMVKGKKDESKEDDDGANGPEIVVSLMTDIADPFSPLPLDEWTYDVSSKSQRDALHQVLQQIPSILNQIVPDYSQSNNIQPALTPPSSSSSHYNNKTTPTPKVDDNNPINCGGAALAVLTHAIQTDPRYTGGRCTLLTSSRPNIGAGAIRDRQEGKHQYYNDAGSETRIFTPLQQHLDHRTIANHNSVIMGAKAQDDRTAVFYRSLGERCTKENITCTVCVTTPLGHEFGTGVIGRNYFDLATLGHLCRETGGKVKWLRVEDSDVLVGLRAVVEGKTGAMDGTRDGTYGHQLRQEMLQSATAFAGSDAVFKLRCSSGIQVKSYLPKNNHPGLVIEESLDQGSPELEMTCVTPDTCIAVDLTHRVGGIKGEVSTSDGFGLYFQTALLYTNGEGRRRIRVTTLGLRTTTSPGEVLRTADIGAVTAMVTRRAVGQLCDEPYAKDEPDKRLQVVRKGISAYCGEVLDNHRQHSSNLGSASAAATTEFLQMLRTFCGGLCRSRMFRAARSSTSAVSSTKPYPMADERAYHLLCGARVSPAMAMLCVYPNLYRLTGMSEEVGDWVIPQKATIAKPLDNLVDDKMRYVSLRPYVRIPLSLQPTFASLQSDNSSFDGIYMLDDGFTIYIYVSPDVNKDVRCELLTYEYGEFFDDDGCENISVVPSGLGDGFVTPSQTLTLSNSSDFGKKVWRIIRQHCMLSSMTGTAVGTCIRPTIPQVVVVIGKGGFGHRQPLDDDLEDELFKSFIIREETSSSF